MANKYGISNEPKNITDPSRFIELGKVGWQKVCRFAVKITPPRVLPKEEAIFSGLIFLCEAAEIAGRGLQTLDMRYYGPSYKLPFMSQYNDMNLSFIVRGEMQEKKLFDNWHNAINPTSTYDFEYSSEYATTIDIYTFTETGEAVYSQSFKEAWPLMVNPIQTIWGDDQIARLPITFTYRRWLTIADPAPLPKLSTLITGASYQYGSVLGLTGKL